MLQWLHGKQQQEQLEGTHRAGDQGRRRLAQVGVAHAHQVCAL